MDADVRSNSNSLFHHAQRHSRIKQSTFLVFTHILIPVPLDFTTSFEAQSHQASRDMDIKSLLNDVPSPKNDQSSRDNIYFSAADKGDEGGKGKTDLLSPPKHRGVQANQTVTLPSFMELASSISEQAKTEISLCQRATEMYGIQRDSPNRAQKITEIVLQPMSHASPPTLNTLEYLTPELNDMHEAIKKSTGLILEVTERNARDGKLIGRKLEFWKSAREARERAANRSGSAVALRHILCQTLRQTRQLGDDELIGSLVSLSALSLDEGAAVDCDVVEELDGRMSEQDADIDVKDADLQDET